MNEISTLLRHRLQNSGQRFFANDNISNVIHSEEELQALVKEVTAKMQVVLDALVIDTDNDHNSKDTAKRYAKMLVLETFGGRYAPRPDITEFPNDRQVDELYMVGPIRLRSACSHHHVPVTGNAWVGVLPGTKLIGLSKFHRIIDHIATRPQIQEEMTEQIADELEKLTEPKGLAVLVSASHMCCSHRGVKDPDSVMVTSVMRGEMRTDKSLKDEFFRLVDLSK